MTKGDVYAKETLKRILREGFMDENPRPHYSDGTPAHTRSVNFVTQSYDYELNESPMWTIRPIAWKSAIKEILWIYQMQSNSIADLHELGIKYWDEWDIGDGTIGQRYGATVKKYDLMNKLLNELKTDPFGRRHIISLWQNEDFETPGLNPCCFQTIWNVRRKPGEEKLYLDVTMIQRSSDYATSVSINELQYQALQLMVAKACDMKPGVLNHVIANCQIYDRHMDNARELISRAQYGSQNLVLQSNPRLVLDTDKTDFYSFTIDDFKIESEFPLKEIHEICPQMKFDLGI